MPRDLWLLLGGVLFTFTLQAFAATAGLPALLRLTPAVWNRGFVWQLVTYPWVGKGAPGLWFLLELFILFLFGRQVFQLLGRRRFWELLLSGALCASLAAVAVAVVAELVAGPLPSTFVLMQGQHTVLVILIAAFATLFGDATIYLFFVLPVRARWFLALEILFGFMGFLGSKDLAGFVGICAAVAFVWLRLTYGGRRRWWREPWLRLQQWWFRLRLARLRRRRGFRIVRDDDPDGPVN